MIFNVAQLLKEGIGAYRDYPVDGDLTAPGEPWESCRVQGRVRLLRTHRGILVTGTLHTAAPATCGWCLESFELPLELQLEEEFFPTIDVNSGLPAAVPDEVDPFTIDSHHTLDLAEATRQAIVVTMPISPRCREDCRGLCQVCGANRNEQPCGCEQTGDARWDSLGQMLQEFGRDGRA